MYQIWYFRSRQPSPKFVFKYIFYISMLTICSNHVTVTRYHLWNNEYVEKYKYVCIGYVLFVAEALIHSCENRKQKDIKLFQSREHVTIAHIWQLHLYKLQKKGKIAAMHKVPYQLQQPSTLTTRRGKNQFIRKLFCSKKEFLWSDYQAVPIGNISRM